MSYNLLLALYSRTDAIWLKRASVGTKAIYCRSRAIVMYCFKKKIFFIAPIIIESDISAFDSALSYILNNFLFFIVICIFDTKIYNDERATASDYSL